MIPPREAGLERSRSELAAARVLAGAGFFAQAVSRAYFAAFYAAEEALSSVGETRSKHSGVISAFARIVVREGALDEQVARKLRSLFERRNDADYVTADVQEEEAAKAIDDADEFVFAVERWLKRRE